MQKVNFFFILAMLAGYSCSSTENQQSENTGYLSSEACSVKEVLRDGKGDFDPWNQSRWAPWYNDKGELIRRFDIDSSVRFENKKDPWIIEFDAQYESESRMRTLFAVTQQGISVDGNGIVLDVRTEKQKLPLDELYALRKEPWNEGCEIVGIFYILPSIANVQPTRVSNFTFMGFKRGVKINGTGDLEEHRLIVEKCVFARNRIGFYTNGYNTLLKDCELLENGYDGIYSGSHSCRNQFIGNVFRDNSLSQHQFSYGDFIGDTFFDSEIRDNRFVESKIKGDFRRIGISLCRNMGESGNLRKNMPHNNIIRSNYFNGYSVAVHVGARMGRETKNDVTGEGRDYAFYNLIDSNVIENTAIGIKVNTEDNTITNNFFRNVDEEIVLHCVFFELKNTTINNQKDDEVQLWYVLDDYKQYSEWFGYQDDLNESIKKDEKLIEVYSIIDSPGFSVHSAKTFVLNPSRAKPEDILIDHRIGPPILTVKGEFSLELSGQEIVAIWNKPVSRIHNIDYYSILIFDDKGTEINRCGRSEIQWKQIAAGYFTRKSGEMEIAAIPGEAIDGKYPVYIFDRGYRIPKEILYENNTDPGIAISADRNHALEVEFN